MAVSWAVAPSGCPGDGRQPTRLELRTTPGQTMADHPGSGTELMAVRHRATNPSPAVMDSVLNEPDGVNGVADGRRFIAGRDGNLSERAT